jgi:hypothetical protein
MSLLFLTVSSLEASSAQASPRIQTTPTPPPPTFDVQRLAKPVVDSAYAEQLHNGSTIYWGVSMACHGDAGQGLTEEWRDA